MAGSKRNKLKKVLSPPRQATSPPQMAADDDELMNDLMAQLDSKDKNVQSESADVLNDMQMNKQVDLAEQAGQKQDPKSRYQARQVSATPLVFIVDQNINTVQARKAAALAETFTPIDEEADARLRKEAKDEEKSIKRTCEELGVKIYEVSDHY